MNSIISTYQQNASEFDGAVMEAINAAGIDNMYLYADKNSLGIVSGAFENAGRHFAYMTYMNIETGEAMLNSFAAMIDDKDSYYDFSKKLTESAAHIYALAKKIHYNDLCYVFEEIPDEEVHKLVMKAYNKYCFG